MKEQTRQEREKLTKGEMFIYCWQYGKLGHFSTHLAEAISRADLENQAKLALGFPDEVAAYKSYAYESGWWENVKKRVGH